MFLNEGNTPLVDDCIHMKIINQWDLSIVKPLLSRISIETVVKFNCNCSFIANRYAQVAKAYTETGYVQDQEV